MKSKPKFNLDLEQILRSSQKELKKWLYAELKLRGYLPQSEDGFLYAPGSIPVLMIAHLDTVHRKPVQHICYTADQKIAMSPEGIGGDDRCGIYMILKIIEKADCHVLFCEDEEIGCVGARKFTASAIAPTVNYIVEMDRNGSNDAVFYQCDNRKFVKFITGFGFKEAFGSCSDISYIAPHMGTAAVNISCGYYNEHRLHEYINLEQMERNALRICEMVQVPSGWFEYHKRQKSFYQASIGDYKELSLWDYMDNSCCNHLSMMKLPEGSYIAINGLQMDSNGHYYIDRKGNVYDYLTQLRAAVLCESTTAHASNGDAVVYCDSGSETVEIISLERAMEMFRTG